MLLYVSSTFLGDNVSDSLRSVVNTDSIKSELESLQQPDILVNVEMKRCENAYMTMYSSIKCIT